MNPSAVARTAAFVRIPRKQTHPSRHAESRPALTNNPSRPDGGMRETIVNACGIFVGQDVHRRTRRHARSSTLNPSGWTRCRRPPTAMTVLPMQPVLPGISGRRSTTFSRPRSDGNIKFVLFSRIECPVFTPPSPPLFLRLPMFLTTFLAMVVAADPRRALD